MSVCRCPGCQMIAALLVKRHGVTADHVRKQCEQWRKVLTQREVHAAWRYEMPLITGEKEKCVR